MQAIIFDLTGKPKNLFKGKSGYMISNNKMIFDYLVKNGIYTREECSKEEHKIYAEMAKESNLPTDILMVDNYGSPYFYRLLNTNITEEEVKMLISLKKLDNLKTIKNCLIFFVVISLFSFFVGFFIANMR